MKKLEIRSLEGEEVETVTRLWVRAGLSHRPLGRDAPQVLRDQFRAAPDLALGAYVEGILIGTLLATDDGRKGWINRLAVDPDYRGVGVGTRLLEEAEKALRRRGRRILAALVEEGNDTSIAFFTSQGYADFKGIHYLTKRDSEEV